MAGFYTSPSHITLSSPGRLLNILRITTKSTDQLAQFVTVLLSQSTGRLWHTVSFNNNYSNWHTDIVAVFYPPSLPVPPPRWVSPIEASRASSRFFYTPSRLLCDFFFFCFCCSGSLIKTKVVKKLYDLLLLLTKALFTHSWRHCQLADWRTNWMTRWLTKFLAWVKFMGSAPLPRWGDENLLRQVLYLWIASCGQWPREWRIWGSVFRLLAS